MFLCFRQGFEGSLINWNIILEWCSVAGVDWSWRLRGKATSSSILKNEWPQRHQFENMPVALHWKKNSLPVYPAQLLCLLFRSLVSLEESLKISVVIRRGTWESLQRAEHSSEISTHATAQLWRDKQGPTSHAVAVRFKKIKCFFTWNRWLLLTSQVVIPDRSHRANSESAGCQRNCMRFAPHPSKGEGRLSLKRKRNRSSHDLLCSTQ